MVIVHVLLAISRTWMTKGQAFDGELFALAMNSNGSSRLSKTSVDATRARTW